MGLRYLDALPGQSSKLHRALSATWQRRYGIQITGNNQICTIDQALQIIEAHSNKWLDLLHYKAFPKLK
jgi:hypothetical protein